MENSINQPLIKENHQGNGKIVESDQLDNTYQKAIVKLYKKPEKESSVLEIPWIEVATAAPFFVTLYYMALVAEGGDKIRYNSLPMQVAYFTPSQYYTWNVPFALGQMLGDLGLKSRGWGNVSVKNNHLDVQVFEFDQVLRWLAEETGEQHFLLFADLMRSSMREQLLPYAGHMVGIAKAGYYSEVVQHIEWDNGYFGKGFYNNLFALGRKVSSIWELLTDNRTTDLLTRPR